MFAVACLDPREPARNVGTARAWLRGGLARLCGDLHGTPGSPDPDVRGRVTVQRSQAHPLRGRPLRLDVLDAALGELAAHPVLVEVLVLSGSGDRTVEEARLTVTPAADENRWLLLVAKVRVPDRADRAALAQRWVDFLADVLDDADPSYAEINNFYPDTLDTALDGVLLRYAQESIERSREFLRGYSWVTVVPAELVSRLGGADLLERSRVVAEVRRLRAGGVLVRATGTPDGYDDAAVRRVFDLVRPVLPPGRPWPLPGFPVPPLVFEDARPVPGG
jgi:hypothetical protein